MAELVGWPTDGAEGSVATEARWRAMARLWAPSGVVAGQGGELAPTLGAGSITVQDGAAWVDGHYCELVSAATEASTANGLLVIRFTPADNTFELVYRDLATTPTQTDATWELPIASMVAGALTDLRVFANREFVRVTALPATITIPSTVNTITITGRLFAGGTGQTITEVLGARFNGIATSTYSRILETYSNSSAFTRDWLSNGNFARLGPVPTNANSNMFLRAVIDARNCSWGSEGFGNRTNAVFAQDRVLGSFSIPARLATLDLLLSPGATAAASVDLILTYG